MIEAKNIYHNEYGFSSFTSATTAGNPPIYESQPIKLFKDIEIPKTDEEIKIEFRERYWDDDKEKFIA